MSTIYEHFFGNDPKIIKAVSLAKNIACTKAPLLITGELGTGKRSLGEFIHGQSNRKSKNLMIVDCNEDKEAIEKTILGHRDEESGRFQKGILELANGGSIIFSNIEGLDEEFQKKLYKIFQELGDYEIDVRLIFTTSKNLSKLVGVGRFYRALYIYFSGTQLHLPPLRERKEDIQFLANSFLAHFCREKEKNIQEISVDAFDKMLGHYWTYNVSELMGAIENGVENCTQNVLNANDLVLGERKVNSQSFESEDDGFKLMSLKEAERLLIKKALIHTSENRTQAAKILGVSIRTLRNKINEYRNEGANYFINLR